MGGVLSAVVRRRSWWPWVAAAAAAGALYGLHASLLAPYLAHRGSEEALLGTGSVGAVLDMAGFQLPVHQVVGILLWGLALYNLFRTGRAPFLGPYALLPLLGLIAARPYWGSMVVPFLILWAGEELAHRIASAAPLRISRRPTSS